MIPYLILLTMKQQFEMSSLKILVFFHAINAIALIQFANSTITLESSRISYKEGILPTPNVIPHINQAGNPTAPEQKYVLTLEEVKEIKLSCQSIVPNRWIFNNVKLYVSTQNVEKKREDFHFSSNLTASLNTEEIEANFSCSNEVSGLLKTSPHEHVVTCVFIRQAPQLHSSDDYDEIIMTIVKNVSIDDCLERPLERSSTCSTSLEVDVESRKGICRTGRVNHGKENLQSHSCDDIDSCRALIHAKSVTEQCYGLIHSSSPGTLNVAFSLEPYPVVVYCAKSDKASDSRGDWTTSILLYPTFAENNMKLLKFYSNFTDALMHNSIKMIALSNDPSKRQIQLETMTGRTEFAEGESVELVCKAISFLYMRGFQIRIQTQESEIVMDTAKQIYEIHKEEHFHLIKQNVTLSQKKYGNITGLSCAGPPWNSEQWAISIISVKISSAGKPFASLSYLVTVDNFIEFTCTYGGWPRPLVKWEFSEPVHIITETGFSQINESRAKNWTETKTIASQTSKSLNVVCYVENFEGNASDLTELKDNPSLSLVTVGAVAATILLFILLTSTILLLASKYNYAKSRIRDLSEGEAKEFFEGIKDVLNNETNNSSAMVDLLPYKSEYEIASDDIKFDNDSKSHLGSGQFSFVIRAHLTSQAREVAVKITKPMIDVDLFKSLLSEVKIMAYVGKHDNVVELVGVCTENITKRSIYIATDICELGCLERFLHKARGSYINLIDGNDEVDLLPLINNSEPNNSISTIDLISFSAQIANGMEYLALKAVIHADLAARNVLLTNERIAKVCDFGLSRKLYSEDNYIKKTKVPLPWRWMAPEALSARVFSTASDVWSYGATLYEVFTLGDKPFPNEEWSNDFVSRLNGGMRMDRPQFGTPEIYNKIMECWKKEPEQRPNFATLRLFFSQIFMQHKSILDSANYTSLE